MSQIAKCPGCTKVFRPRTNTANACWESVSVHMSEKSRQGCSIHRSIHTALYRHPYGCPGCSQIFHSKESSLIHLDSMNDDQHARFKLREGEASPPMDIAATQQIARRRGRETDTLASQLYSAAKSGNTNTVRFLLECGVNPDAGGEDGFTPLMTAAEAGHAHVVSLLLSNPRCNASLRNSYGQVAYSMLTHDPMNPRPPCFFPQPPSQRL
jgi:uncharacterized C2H2 Zn-finger protein